MTNRNPDPRLRNGAAIPMHTNCKDKSNVAKDKASCSKDIWSCLQGGKLIIEKKCSLATSLLNGLLFEEMPSLMAAHPR